MNGVQERDQAAKRERTRTTAGSVASSLHHLITSSLHHFITPSLSLLLAPGCNAAPIVPPLSHLAGTLYINELMASNGSTLKDEAGDYDDWVELYNAGDEPIYLSTMYLSDNFVRPTKWSFPDTFIPADGYLVLWCDGETGEGDLHTSFKLNAGPGEQLGLYTTDGEHLYLVDTLHFGPQRSDTSLARIPDGDDWAFTSIATPGSENLSDVSALRGRLFLNEVMAANDSTIKDEAGDYDDWVELYNAGSEPARLAGLYLSDNLKTPLKWAFPDTAISPGGFLLVWADNEPTEGPLHATFNLGSLLGEQLGVSQLFAGHALLVDTLTFGPQHPDTSFGRYPDAGPAWQYMPHPTPRKPNQQ